MIDVIDAFPMSDCRILDSLIHSQSVLWNKAMPLCIEYGNVTSEPSCRLKFTSSLCRLDSFLVFVIVLQMQHQIYFWFILHTCEMLPSMIYSLNFLSFWYYRRCETMRTTKTLLSNNADKIIHDRKFSWSCEVKTIMSLSPYIDVSLCMRKMMRTPTNRSVLWRGMSIYNYWEQITWFLYHSSFFAFLLCFLDMRRLRKNLGSICNRIMFEGVKRWCWSKVRGFPGYWLYFPIISASFKVYRINWTFKQTYSFQGFGGVIPSLLDAIGMGLDGHVTTSVVLPLSLYKYRSRQSRYYSDFFRIMHNPQPKMMNILSHLSHFECLIILK